MSRRGLGVNVDHIASLRQVRRSRYPDPVHAAAIIETAGADQIVVHLREDRRHIQERDARLLRQTLQTGLNVLMSTSSENLKIALDIEPDLVTLVPETRDQPTTLGGLDVVHHRDSAKKHVQTLRDADVSVCLFVDPDLDQIRGAHRIDATAVEINTSKYAEARGDSERRSELQRVADAARAAGKLGLRVFAGHGLHYHNIRALVPIEEIERFNIGHSIIARATLTGLDQAVREMLALLKP